MDDTMRAYRPLGKSRLLALGSIILLLLLLVSCTSRIGWGVVLWSIKGTDAKAGTIVPVYVKSNITKTYIVGLNEDRNTKIEIPLWQIEMFGTKRAANKRIKEMGEWTSIYMIAMRDGLPVRQKPANNEKRVYRLHEFEMVKVLGKAEGEPVYTGGTVLQGDWYQVLTMDGTKGYVFSNTMRIFDESTGQAPSLPTESTNQETIASILTSTWRPSWYSTMLENDSVDLDYFSMQYGLFGDMSKKQVRIELPGFSQDFQYASITQEQGWLVFSPTNLRIRRDGQDSIVACWDPSNMPAQGQLVDWHEGGTSIRFIILDQDLRPAIQAEENRRQNALRSFFTAMGTTGTIRLDSETAGSIVLWPSGLYSWDTVDDMPAGFAPSGSDAGAQQKGKAVFGLRLSDGLSGEWQGGFSLYPDTTGERNDYVYKTGAGSFTIAKSASKAGEGIVSALDTRLGSIEFKPEQNH
ncbi:MAG: SH3 domain-containing protein [Spirochaetaceae bacterium]|nr:SH3 domain-containing protein [Spirochaetaceae bacterium]